MNNANSNNTSTALRPVRVYHRPSRISEGGGIHYPREVLHEYALFHAFGQESDETNDGPVHGISAVVELPDGTVITAAATMIQFLDVTSAE